MEIILATNVSKWVPKGNIKLPSKWEKNKSTIQKKSMKPERAIMPKLWSEEEEKEDSPSRTSGFL